MQSLEGHTKAVTSACFSYSGLLVATASLDTTAKVWTLSGKEEATFHGHMGALVRPGKAFSTAFSIVFHHFRKLLEAH